MAVIGHWDSLAEAQKLVQTQYLLAGVLDTIIEEGQIVPMMPLMQIDSKEVIYYREKALADVMSYRNIGEQLTWEADQTYGDKVSLSLAIASGQRRLDNFLAETYKNPNDYRAQKTREIVKGIIHFIETEAIYGSGATTPAPRAQGLAKMIVDIASVSEVPSDYSTTLNIDEASALSLANLRALTDSIRPNKPDILLMNRTFARKFDAMALEAPLTISATVSHTPQATIQTAINDLGQRVTFFDGIPIVRSDYITLTESATGLVSTGSSKTSIFALKFGQIEEGGLGAVFGGQGGSVGSFFRTDVFAQLEDYDASGLRVLGYFNFGVGSVKSIGRIYDITASGAITV